jgi:hypothetical protein
MTAETTPELDWIPDACTLPTADRPLRMAEFDALLAGARDTERITTTMLRVTLAGGSQLPATVRDLTEREARCCSFFTFSVSVEPPDTVRLDIEVPAAYVVVLDALANRAQDRR